MSEKCLEVRITDGQNMEALARAEKLLDQIHHGYDSAVSRAMNRAAISGRAAAVATVRNEYTARASAIRNSFTIKKANWNKLEAEIISSGSSLPLIDYRLKPKTDTTGSNRAQVKVAVKKKGGLKPLGHFVYNGRVLRRLGSRSMPIEEKRGPAIPLLVGGSEIAENIEKAMQEAFLKRLEHETWQILDKGDPGGKNQ